MRGWIGDLGHAGIIIAFVTALAAAFCYFASLNKNALVESSWKRMGRLFFYAHSISVMVVIASLFTIIYNHFYEYHYAWSHSSDNLPVHFMISCFWEGQEGSFLLWVFWHVVLGLFLIKRGTAWEGPVMGIFALVQAFLASMILGVSIVDFKIGSSPFILLRDAMPELPVWDINPNYVPEDGRGLNPLLQNYWMVIHPPTLFLGFAATLVPFAFLMGGLLLNKGSEWIKPAVPYSLFAAAVLGLGIMMGAYWAYETLNFGGYWNWDPVENAVYIPWLTLIAAFHTMLLGRKNGTAVKMSAILVTATFVLILYATFLTRSGILGNASVHSFTDLGLSGQLLLYLLFFLGVSIVILWRKWHTMPITEKEANLYSKEFWLFCGITALLLASFQVFASTSIPVYNAIGSLFGLELNLAPPADQMQHYAAWQIWFTGAIVIFSAVGQFVWWTRQDKNSLTRALVNVLTPVLLVTTVIIVVAQVFNYSYIIFLVAGLYGIVGNGYVLARQIKLKVRVSGGSIAHIGLGLMAVGVLFSSGYSKVVSINNTGLVYRKEFSDDMNAENVLLWKNKPTKMGEYQLTYKGDAKEVRGFPVYVKKEYLKPTFDEFRFVTRGELSYNEKVYFAKGDTVTVQSENTYYALEFAKDSNNTFMLYPRAQVNPAMGLLASPAIKKFGTKDLYAHVSAILPPNEEKEWSETEELSAAVGDTLYVNDYVAQFIGAVRVDNVEGIELGPNDAAVKAQIRIFGLDDNYILEPIFVIQGSQVGRIPAVLQDLGVRVTVQSIDPANQTFTFGFNTSQKDWVILKAMEKPLIDLVWIGTIMVLVGFTVSIVKYSKTKKFLQKPVRQQAA